MTIIGMATAKNPKGLIWTAGAKGWDFR